MIIKNEVFNKIINNTNNNIAINNITTTSN